MEVPGSSLPSELKFTQLSSCICCLCLSIRAQILMRSNLVPLPRWISRHIYRNPQKWEQTQDLKVRPLHFQGHLCEFYCSSFDLQAARIWEALALQTPAHWRHLKQGRDKGFWWNLANGRTQWDSPRYDAVRRKQAQLLVRTRFISCF